MAAVGWPLIAVRHVPLYPKPAARPTPFETLAFCPRTRARKRRRDLAAAAVGGGCLPKSRMVLILTCTRRCRQACSDWRRRRGRRPPNRGSKIHARGHLHRRRRTHRGPVSPGPAEERPDRHRAASAPAIRGHDEPSDHLPALLRLRAPELFRAALQFPRGRAQPGLVRPRPGRIVGRRLGARLGAVDQPGGPQLLDRRLLLRRLDRHAAADAAARDRGLHLDRPAREPLRFLVPRPLPVLRA